MPSYFYRTTKRSWALQEVLHRSHLGDVWDYMSFWPMQWLVVHEQRFETTRNLSGSLHRRYDFSFRHAMCVQTFPFRGELFKTFISLLHLQKANMKEKQYLEHNNTN